MRRGLVVLAAISSTALAACASSSDRSGIVTTAGLVTPAALSAQGQSNLPQLPDPGTATVIIYSHGTERPQVAEDCDRWYNRVPDSVRALSSDPGTVIYFLCSGATDRRVPGSYIYKREREIERTVDSFLELGVPARNIFLAGHSAGGWSSLMLMDKVGIKFNAVIAFAPACCGRRSESTIYPIWRGQIRPTQVREMVDVQDFQALVFAYEDDPFNRPEDMRFLTDAFPDSVVLSRSSCAAGHFTHVRDCKRRRTTKLIRQYIEERKATFSM